MPTYTLCHCPVFRRQVRKLHLLDVTLSPAVQFPHVFMYLVLSQILVLASHVLIFKTPEQF